MSRGFLYPARKSCGDREGSPIAYVRAATSTGSEKRRPSYVVVSASCPGGGRSGHVRLPSNARTAAPISPAASLAASSMPVNQKNPCIWPSNRRSLAFTPHSVRRWA